MTTRAKTACFTGHRPKDLPWGRDETHPWCQFFKQNLESAIKKAIENGFSHFITGMAEGVDTYAAEILIALRDQQEKNITIEAAVPCSNQCEYWSNSSKQRYSNLLSKMDKVTVLSEGYTPNCMQERNIYMLEHSSLLIAGFSGKKNGGTFSTITRAQSTNKQIIIVPTNTSQISFL